ncbi:MAG TPA: hypothetical protein VG870_04020 [Chitinophagaceae bacterium]|nr:hypothetical protein [Chitinophagaceae bacterium]
MDAAGFSGLALEVFRFQFRNNPVYRDFCNLLGKDPDRVNDLDQVPYLPIGLFKTREVTTGSFRPELVFESSGTTQTVNSRHLVRDASLYEESFLTCFTSFYGPVTDWCILGLLPSYLERGHSSLVYMVNRLVEDSRHPDSGFYLYDFSRLHDTLLRLDGQKVMLIGVTFALLDFAAQFPQPLHNVVVMETGGMKGRKKELVRQQVHALLRQAFGLSAIHSEYGMTELLSQAYAGEKGLFRCPPWMQIRIRDDEDPLTVHAIGTGGINVIDLANVYSCSFLATDDAGTVHPGGHFEVLGRIDNSDLRGCSLMAL